jgi:N-acetyl-gamma-glutamyl-phosphate reductase
MRKLKVGIIGATGYTGSELVRILQTHPHVDIDIITSESYAGEELPEVHPLFHSLVETRLVSSDEVTERDLDVVFLALPHGVSMEYVKKYAGQDFKIIDLSGDFRLNEPATYEDWYGKDHTYPEGFQNRAYGMPELFHSEIANAQLVANPGCYPTASVLGLAPLVHAGLVDPRRIVVDAKSGTTGAGIKAKPSNHFSTVNENFKAYGLKRHRHSIEIQQILTQFAGQDARIQFTPHLLPIDRGILATIYAQPNGAINERKLKSVYQDFYGPHPFVRLVENPPSVKQVRGSNFCDLFVTYDDRTDNILVLSAIDNLVKGAAGQAVHNMNLMFGLDETEGLGHIPVHP